MNLLAALEPVTDAEAILRFVESQTEAAGREPSGPGPMELAGLACRAAAELLEEKGKIVPLLARANRYTERQADFAIEGALAELDVETFEELWREQGLALPGEGEGEAYESGSDEPCDWPELTLVVGGGAIPQPNVQAVIAAMMVAAMRGGRVLFRPSSFDRVLVPLLLKKMDEILQKGDEEAEGGRNSICERVLCATWPREDEELSARVIGAADSVVVFGDETTQEFFRANTKAVTGTSVFSYGPRISFAVVDLSERGDCLADEEIDEIASGLALDVWAYDQQGCLSPMAVYVLGGDGGNRGEGGESGGRRKGEAGRIFDALGLKLEDMRIEWGGSPGMSGDAALRIHTLRRLYAMEGSGLREVRASSGVPGWTLLWDETKPELEALPGYATLKISPLADWAALIELVRPRDGQLQGMGLWPDESAVPEDALKALGDMGLSRVFEFGEMQRPPLDWLHDGNPFFPV